MSWYLISPHDDFAGTLLSSSQVQRGRMLRRAPWMLTKLLRFDLCVHVDRLTAMTNCLVMHYNWPRAMYHEELSYRISSELSGNHRAWKVLKGLFPLLNNQIVNLTVPICLIKCTIYSPMRTDDLNQLAQIVILWNFSQCPLYMIGYQERNIWKHWICSFDYP